MRNSDGMSATTKRKQRWIVSLCVVSCYVALGVTACSEGTHPTTSVRTLDDAKPLTNGWVDHTIDATFLPSDQRTVRAGDRAGTEYPGTLPCDPQDGHHQSYHYEVSVRVPPTDLDVRSLEAWRNLERQGFVLNESAAVSERVDRGIPPGTDSPTSWHLLSTHDGFKGEIVGNRIDSVVYVGVTTPCFDTNQ